MRRGADIADVGAVAKPDRGRISPVLAADPYLKRAVRGAPVFHGYADEAADAPRVERLEGISLEYVLVIVLLQELALGVLSAKAVRGLRKVVRAKAKERRAGAGQLAGRKGAPNDLDHGAKGDAHAAPLALCHPVEYLLYECQLRRGADLRHHDLRAGVDAAPPQGGGRVEDGLDLRLVYLGIRNADAHAAVPHHGVDFGQLAGPFQLRPYGAALRPGGPAGPHQAQLVAELFGGAQELVQGRVEQPYRDWMAAHLGEYLFKVAALHCAEPLEEAAPLAVRRLHYHVSEQADAALLVEHSLGPAQPYPLGAVLARLCGRSGRVRVGPDSEPLGLPRPLQDGSELGRDLGIDQGEGAPVHGAGAAVYRYRLALLDRRAARHGAPAAIVVYVH